MDNLLVKLGFLALTGILIYLMIKAINHRPYRRCPRCGGALDADPYKYKNIIEWTCRECQSSFETLRSQQ